jgi:hypothetical protein
MTDGESRRFAAAWLVLSAFVALPLWVGEYMPMVDIPQHAAQLSIGQHWNDPAFNYPELYQVNNLVNHVAAYTLVRGLAAIVPLSVAIKLALTVFVWALPAAGLFLLRVTGGSRWWSIALFPVAYGFSTYWGFLNYVLAVPLGLILIGQSARYAMRPSNRSALALFVLTVFLFVSHVLVLVFAALAASAIVLVRGGPWRWRLRGLAALAGVLPLLIAWWAAVQRATPPSETGTKTELAFGLDRLYDLLSYQVGIEPTVPNALMGALLLLSPFILGARPAREWWRWIPFAMSIFAVLLVPLHALGVAFLYGRFATFVLPGLLFGLDPAPSPVRRGSALVSVLVALQLSAVARTFYSFDRESAGLGNVLARLQPHKRVLYFDTAHQSPASFDWAYLHFGCWYQVERGGAVDFSFAKFFPNRYRYKAERRPKLPDNIEWQPFSFRWAMHGGEMYDYILVKGPVPRAWFPPGTVDLVVLAVSGPWVAIGRASERRAAAGP